MYCSSPCDDANQSPPSPPRKMEIIKAVFLDLYLYAQSRPLFHVNQLFPHTHMPSWHLLCPSHLSSAEHFGLSSSIRSNFDSIVFLSVREGSLYRIVFATGTPAVALNPRIPMSRFTSGIVFNRAAWNRIIPNHQKYECLVLVQRETWTAHLICYLALCLNYR